MKLNLLHTALAALLMAGTAQAMAQTQDVPATVSISGVLNNVNAGCVVTLDKEVVYMENKVSHLPLQGEQPYKPTVVNAFISGEPKTGQTNVVCSEAVKAGHIALKFTGTPDNADGNVLANSYVESGGAKGVGVGIYGPTKQPIEVNTGTLENLTVLSDLRGSAEFNLELVKLANQEVTPGAVTSSLTVEIERL